MPGRWGDTPFLALTSCLVVGIALSRAVPHCQFSFMLAAALSLTSAAFLALCRSRKRLALCAALSTVVVSGLLLSVAQRDGLSERDLRSLLSRGAVPLGQFTMFDGCVADDSQSRGGEILTAVDLHGYRRGNSWIPCRGKVLLRMPEITGGGLEPENTRLRSGDRLRGWAELSVLRNFQNPGALDRVAMLMRRGIFLGGRVKSPRVLEVIPRDCGSAWTDLVGSARDRLSAGAQVLKNEGRKTQAAVLESLLVGNYTDLDSTTREIFQNSGTYHVLVVSGLHVAWIAGVILGILRLLRMPRGASRLLTAGAIFLYSNIVGSQASISRCLWMFGLYLIGEVLFRRAAPANIVLASAFLLLVLRPDWLFDSGFQLSFLSVIAICATALPAIEKAAEPLEPFQHAGESEALNLQSGVNRRFGRRLRFRCEILAEAVADRCRLVPERLTLGVCRLAARAGSAISSMVLISCSVQVWLEPVLAYYFNRLSWIAPLANLAIVPLSSAVLAAGMIDALTCRAFSSFHGVTHAAGWLASLLLKITARVSAWPGAWQRCPTPPLGWVITGIVLLSMWHFLRRRRFWVPLLYVATLLVCLSRAIDPVDALAEPGTEASETSADRIGSRALRLTFLDVGEGDSLVIRFPDSSVWLVDGGGIHRTPDEDEASVSFDVGEAVVSRYLWHYWIARLDCIVLSHPDQDHAGGVPAVLKNFRVEEFVYGETRSDPMLDRILETARERRTVARLTEAGNTVMHSGVGIRVLNPPGDGAIRTTNDNSVVLRLEFGRFSALLTGDLEVAGETAVLSHSASLDSLLLKASHHGSRHGSMEPFLNRVSPRWAVISVGRNNPFGHPAPEVLARLLRRGVRPLLTTDHGAVSFETDGIRYVLESYTCGILEKGLLPAKMR